MNIFIIAEIGINHNGDLNIAKQLIDVAKECCCDAVKFQKRDINLVYTEDYLKSSRNSPWGTTQREQKEGLEFGNDEYNEISNYCEEKNIEWFASAWDINSQKFLRKFNCKYNKVASPMIVYKDLLEEIAREGKHTLISTGMCTYEDINNAVQIFARNDCPFELMHAVSTYPLKPEDTNLKMIQTLKAKFKCDVGYSGHEQNIEVSMAAAALGITSLERHLTLDQKMYGSDQSSSIEPNELKKLVSGVRLIENAMGDGQKRILKDEIINAEKLRQHILCNSKSREN